MTCDSDSVPQGHRKAKEYQGADADGKDFPAGEQFRGTLCPQVAIVEQEGREESKLGLR